MMIVGASTGLWIVFIAAFAELGCGQRAEPVATTGTSTVAAAQTPAVDSHETKEARKDAPQDSPQAPAPACAADALRVVRSISPTHCEVPRAVFLDDRDCLLAQPQLTPHLVEGRVVGYRHDSIPSRSVYAACGVRSGDVWTKLNGEALNSPDQALKLYPSLRESERLQIELLRGARALEVLIELR